MANDIDKTSPHYKGEFGSIYEVNQKFPNGGVASDYVVIDGWAHYWNADRGTWCVNAKRDSYWDELITNIINHFKTIKGASYMGVATTDTVPDSSVAKMFYFALAEGKYTNFGNQDVSQGVNVLITEDGKTWKVQSLISVAQDLGASTTMLMSQKAIADAINRKANTTDVNEALGKKADKSYVDTELGKKADKSYVDTELGKKADKSYVDTELGKKFDKANIVQTTGDAEDKVMSQKAVSDKLSDLSFHVDASIENALSGKMNNISIAGNTLTIGKDGFSVFVLGKRITFSGTEDIVLSPDNKIVRKSLYLNTKYILETPNIGNVNFTEHSDVFVEKVDATYNGLLFAEWYIGNLLNIGLIAGIKQLSDTNKQLSDTNKQLSDTNKQLSDTNKIQIYLSDGTIPYIEEDKTNSKVYVHLGGNICVRMYKNGLTLKMTDLAEQLGVELVTSPKGVGDCFVIDNLQDFVFDLSEYKFKIVKREEVTLNHVILIVNIAGSVNISESKYFLSQWYDDRIKQLSDTNKQLSDTNKIQIYLSDGTIPYIEEDKTNSKVYVHLGGNICVRMYKNGLTLKMTDLAEQLGVELVTSPKGVGDCFVIDNLQDFVFDLSEYKFKIVKREEVTLNHVILIVNIAGSVNISESKYFLSQWYDDRINGLEDNINNSGHEIRIRNNVAFNSDFKALFFSDVHGSSENIDRIKEKATIWGAEKIDCILNGGDTVLQFNSEKLEWYNQLVQNATIPFISAVGNHDAWSTNYWTWDTNKNIYSLLTSKVKEYVPSIVQPTDVSTTFGNYYYYDTEKVRVIVLLSLKFNSDDVFYDDAQDTWLKSVLADAKEKSKAVIIMNHGPIDPKDSEEVESNWTSRLSWVSDIADTQHMDERILKDVDSFIDSGGTFICYLAGHSHLDYILKSKSHPRQMCFVTTSARYNFGSDCLRSSDRNNMDYDSYNYIGVDLTHSVIKVQRIGMNTNAWMQEHNTFCWDFKNHKLVADN